MAVPTGDGRWNPANGCDVGKPAEQIANCNSKQSKHAVANCSRTAVPVLEEQSTYAI